MELLSNFLIIFCALNHLGHSRDCIDAETCEECTSKTTWNPSAHCRWCPKDNKCHTYGAIRTNPCKLDENIRYPENCPNPFAPTVQYDESLAYNMFKFAAAAYMDNPGDCFPEEKGYEFDEIAYVKCDMAGNRCFAYTAISHHDQAIVLSYRGTTTETQLIEQALQILLKPKTSHSAGGSVHAYFQNAYDSLSCLTDRVRQLRKRFPDYKLWVTGHSLGGALASIAALNFVYYDNWPKDRVKSTTFGMPRVGSYWYARAHDKHVPLNWIGGWSTLLI